MLGEDNVADQYENISGLSISTRLIKLHGHVSQKNKNSRKSCLEYAKLFQQSLTWFKPGASISAPF